MMRQRVILVSIGLVCVVLGSICVFGDDASTVTKTSSSPIYCFRESNSLRLISQSQAVGEARLTRTTSLSVLCEKGKERKFHVLLCEDSATGWQPAKQVNETLVTKTIYGDKYSIPLRITSESSNSVLEYDLVDFPGALWREDGKCGACKCDGACGNACTVTIPSQFVSESLAPSQWVGLEYQVKPTVLKAGKPNVVELSVTVNTTELLEKPNLKLSLTQTIAKPVAAKPGAAKDGCGSGCGGGGGGCGEHSSSAKAAKGKPLLSLKALQWGKELKVASAGCGGGCGGGVRFGRFRERDADEAAVTGHGANHS